MATIEDQVNHHFASLLGFTPQQVAVLRQEFKKFGRNPFGSELEILAIEHGYDEQKVKELFELHLAQLRKTDGLPSEKRSVYD